MKDVIYDSNLNCLFADALQTPELSEIYDNRVIGVIDTVAFTE